MKKTLAAPLPALGWSADGKQILFVSFGFVPGASHRPSFNSARTHSFARSHGHITPGGVNPQQGVVSINLEEEIRRRAYEIYLERGMTAGDQSQDWLVAEREVRSRQMQQRAG